MLPKVIKPMLALAAPEPFDSDEHLFEVKWNGVRCLAFVEKNKVRLQSRQLLDMTAQFPELAGLRELPDGTVLDGELVRMEDGKPNLSKAQQRVHLQDRHRIRFLSERSPVVYVVFDILYLRGRSVMSDSLENRRGMLSDTIALSGWPGVKLVESIAGRGCDLYTAVRQLGLEGVMAKRADGPYLPGKRSRVWLKIKPATGDGGNNGKMRMPSRPRDQSMPRPVERKMDPSGRA